MKILFVPKTHTSKHITSSSSVAYWIDMCAIRPDLQLDIIVPEDTITDDIVLPNVKFLKIADNHGDPFVNHLSHPAWDYVRRRNKQYSAVLTNVPYWVDTLNTALWERIWGGLQPRYTTPLLCVSDEWADKELQWTETQWAKAVMSSIMQRHRVMVLTEPDAQKILVDVMPYKPLVNLGYVEVIKPIVYSEDVEPMIRHNDGKLRIFHGGTVPKRKRIDELIDVVEKVRVMHPNVSIILASPKELPEKYKEIDFVEWHENCTRDEFKKLQYEADVAYCGPKYIGTGLGYVQNVFAGLPMVFLYGKWLEGRIPKEYSLVAQGKRELQNMIQSMAVMYKDGEIDGINTEFKRLQNYWNQEHNSLQAVNDILFSFSMEGKKAMLEAMKTSHFLWDILREAKDEKMDTYAEFVEVVQSRVKSDKIDIRKIVSEGMFYNIKALRGQEW